MIHKFRVANYYSIREAIEVDFRVPGTTPELACLPTSPSSADTRVPAVVALLGPNGAGKTKLLSAIAHALQFAVQSFGQGDARTILLFIPFLTQDAHTLPTRITVEFDAPWPNPGSSETNALVRYTLELEHEPNAPGQKRVRYEALHRFPEGRPRRIFERRADKPLALGIELAMRPSDDRLKSIPPDVSVISFLAALGVGSFVKIANHLRYVQVNLTLEENITALTQSITDYYRNVPDIRNRAAEHLQRFDIGIRDLSLLEASDKKNVLTFQHRGLDVPIVFPNESAGTKQIVRLYPQPQYALDHGLPVIVDALDRDLHTELLSEILGWFRNERTNPHKAQLICSLQSTSVLDELEKEELFLVEKTWDGATRAYGAREVAGVRRGASLQRLYLSGSLGAVPHFG